MKLEAMDQSVNNGDSVKWGYGWADADGGWRMGTPDDGLRTADGGRRITIFRKKKIFLKKKRSPT